VTKEEIKQYLSELNEELRSIDVKGEICLYGGAVMALAYQARPDTDALMRSLNRSDLFEKLLPQLRSDTASRRVG
jgi:hypothetical protein